MNRLILIFGLLLSTTSLATTYVYTGPLYPAADISGTGTPAYTTAMQIAGSITTTSPLPSNLPMSDIGPNGTNLLQDWSFSDGLHTYTPATSSIFGGTFDVATDGSGNITEFDFGFLSPAPPNTVGQLVNLFEVGSQAPTARGTATSQVACSEVQPTENNTCVGIEGTYASAVVGAPGTFAPLDQPPPPPPPGTSQSIPAPASSWFGLAALMLFMSLVAVWFVPQSRKAK